MAKRKIAIPQYGTVTLNGIDYYRTRVQNADGKLVALYARTPEELYDKELGALEQIDNDAFCRKSPTVADYCEKWLLMQSVHVRATTLIDYTSKVRRRIIKELGQMRMADVTLDDIQLALVPVSEKSASVYMEMTQCQVLLQSKSNRKDSFSLFRYWRFALQKHGLDQKVLVVSVLYSFGLPAFSAIKQLNHQSA